MTELVEEVSPTDASSGTGGGSREASTNGFTAVNGRNSPSQGQKRIGTDESIPHAQPEGHATYPHQVNGSDSQKSTTVLNGSSKRTSSAAGIDEDEDEDSEDSERSCGSPEQRHDALPSPGRPPYPGPPPVQPPSWHGRPHDDQSAARLLEPIQRDNQQHANGHYNHMEVDPQPAPLGMRPGYHQDEATGMITTNAGVQMDPKKRKRVREVTIELSIFTQFP